MKKWLKPFKYAAMAACIGLTTSGAYAEKLGFPEKEELKFGFIKLTDMAPIAVAMKMVTSKTKVFT